MEIEAPKKRLKSEHSSVLCRPAMRLLCKLEEKENIRWQTKAQNRQKNYSHNEL